MMGDVNPYASQPRPRHAAWMDKRTLSNAGHSPVNCRRPVRPGPGPGSPESPRNPASQFFVRIRGLPGRGRSQRTGLPGQPVSGQRSRTSDRRVTFVASVRRYISSVQLTTYEPMPCLS